MNDQLMEETIITLHPDALAGRQGTEILRRLMRHYAWQHPPLYWARLVSSPVWREEWPALIRAIAERDWICGTDEPTALQCAELTAMAVEACAGRWAPEQCRLAAVRIDGKMMMSLVCSMGDCST